MGIFKDRGMRRNLCLMCAVQLRENNQHVRIKLRDNLPKLKLMLMRNDKLREFFEQKKIELIRNGIDSELDRMAKWNTSQMNKRQSNMMINTILEKLEGQPELLQ